MKTKLTLAEKLKEGKRGNRLISEFIAHADFSQLLSAMEIYMDRKVLPQMSTMNAMYKYAEQTRPLRRTPRFPKTMI